MSEDLLAWRKDWIRRKMEEKNDEQHFANGFRAGLQCALYALEGRDIIGSSIDPEPRRSRKTQ